MTDAATPGPRPRATTVAGGIGIALLSALGWVGQEFVATKEAVARVEERQAVALESQTKRLDSLDGVLRDQSARLLVIERAVTGGDR